MNGTAVLNRKRVGYLFAYKDPDYIRTRSMLKALRGLENIDLVPFISQRKTLSRFVDPLHQLRAYLKTNSLDALILAFRGYELFWPVRILLGSNTPLIFDAMMSPYAALTEERKFGLWGRLAGIPWRPIERSIMHDSTFLLTDTPLHQEYLHKLHGIPRSKIFAIPVGAEESGTNTTAHTNFDAETFTVLFYGSFLPLHGVDIIIEAASHLNYLPIHFQFVGGSKGQARKLHKLCHRYGVSNYSHQPWIDYRVLISEVIPGASLCLGGPFGNTPQARRVVTGKTSQCLASGKVTVIGHIDSDYGFRDRENCLLVPQGQSEPLAEAILWAYDNQLRLPDIGHAAKIAYQKQLSIDVIQNRLNDVLQKILQ